MLVLSEYNSNLSPNGTIFNASIYNRKAFSNHGAFQDCSTAKLHPVKAKAAPSNRNTKPNSVICAVLIAMEMHQGNVVKLYISVNLAGAVLFSQCKGSGLNSVDFFNGQLKAGDSCWLCGRKKEMCGNCNGAGFIGGFYEH
ncbi:hypothetical protein CRYUN_Cryun02cG0059600 [Craigia yunnanensis]